MKNKEEFRVMNILIRRSRNFQLICQSSEINMSVHEIVNKSIEKALYDWDNNKYMVTSKFYINKNYDPYIRRQFYIRTDLYDKLIPISKQLARSIPVIMREIIVGYHMCIQKEQVKIMKKNKR